MPCFRDYDKTTKVSVKIRHSHFDCGVSKSERKMESAI